MVEIINKNKRGWIRLVEAFLSVLLIASVLIIIVNQQNIKTNDISSSIYNYEVYMIRSIELNDSLRSDIVSISESNLPANFSSSSFPESLKNKIENMTLRALFCEGQICRTNSSCNFWQDIKDNVYTQRVFISSSYQTYNPRQLKIFCWPK